MIQFDSSQQQEQPASARSRTRGFALLLVMLIAVACVVIAVGLMAVQGKGKESAVANEYGDRARLLAETGIQRGIAYAAVVKAAQTDYDLVLDPDIIASPGNSADCTNLDTTPFNLGTGGSAPHAGSTTFLPNFTEAGVTTSVFPPGSGIQWRTVPIDGGAYLVRFEDNNDDSSSNNLWGPASDNNLINNCREGNTNAAFVDNPARDRDNAIWVVAMGIYPGTDPTKASNRAVVRRLINQGTSPPTTAFFVGAKLKDRVRLHNLVSRVEVVGNIENSPTACGSVKAGGSNTAVSAGVVCNGPPANPFAGLATQAITPPADPPVGWTPLDERWYDWESPCNFYGQQDLGFFYWDPTAPDGTNACAGYNGPLVKPSLLSRDAVTVPQACWVPLVLNIGAGTSICVDPSGVPTATPCVVVGDCPAVPGFTCLPIGKAEPYPPYAAAGVGDVEFVTVPGGVSPAPLPNGADCIGWEPQASTTTFTDPGTGVPPGSWYTSVGPTATTRTKPDWSLCGGTTYPESQVEWGLTPPNPAPSGGSFETCAGVPGCDGATKVLDFCGLAAKAKDEAVQFTFTNDAERAAIPTGVYFVSGDFKPNSASMGCTPTDQTNPSAGFTYPMMTLIVEGKYDEKNAVQNCWGTGTKKMSYPSLVTGGDFKDGTGTSAIFVAGSLYVGNKADLKKNVTVFGRVHVNNELKGAGGGAFFTWRYIRDIGNSSAAAVTAPPARLEFATGL